MTRPHISISCQQQPWGGGLYGGWLGVCGMSDPIVRASHALWSRHKCRVQMFKNARMVKFHKDIFTFPGYLKSHPLLSCSVAPIIFPFLLVAAPLNMVFPKKRSLLFQGHWTTETWDTIGTLGFRPWGRHSSGGHTERRPPPRCREPAVTGIRSKIQCLW